MFDKIKLIAGIQSNNIALIVKTNGLDTNTRAGKTYYDNLSTKNFTGMYIKIDLDNESIIIDGSLHKYFNNLQTNKQENHSDNFTLKESFAAFDKLAQNTNINFQDAKVKRLEIGLNLYTSKPPTDYINLIKSISPKGKKESLKIIENPKFKDKSVIVSNMHHDNRKYYKIYDKIHELKSDRKEYPENINILRIETVWQRIDKVKVNELLHPFYLKDVIKEFIDTWQSIEFERILKTPKGLHQSKVLLIKEILQSGNAELLIDKYRKQLKSNETTEKQFRTIREFIKNDWNNIKKQIYLEQYPEEHEFRMLFLEQINKCKKVK